MSRLFTFAEGASEANVKCYMHMNDYAPQGWYDKAERTMPLRYAVFIKPQTVNDRDWYSGLTEQLRVTRGLITAIARNHHDTAITAALNTPSFIRPVSFMAIQ